MDMYENIIRNYIDAYNAFDVDEMVANFDEEIRFENISEGNSSLVLYGLAAFRDQAEKSKTYFTERKQAITSLRNIGKDRVEVNIDYAGKLAIDLPNGMLRGDTLQLQGKSVFTFRNNKIIALTDHS